MNTSTNTAKDSFVSANWIPLLFSGFYFFSFFFTELTLPFVTFCIAIYLCFLVLFFVVNKYVGKYTVAFILTMIALGILGSSHNSSAGMIFGYAAFYSGFYLSRKQAALLTSLCLAAILGSAFIFELWHAYYIFPSVMPTISLVFFGILAKQEKEHRQNERESEVEKRQLTRIAERERIARDLHDTLGHTLTSVALKAQLAKKLGEQGQMEEALKEIQHVAELASDTLSEVRQAISGYRKLGLEEQWLRLSSRLQDKGFSVSKTGHAEPLNAREEAALILIITEGVTNILRHSSGDRVTVALSTVELDPKKPAIQLRIWDNGTPSDTYTIGNGLKGMQERLTEFSGSLNIDTSDGFTLSILIPLREQQI